MYRAYRKAMRYGGAILALLSFLWFVVASSGPSITASFIPFVIGTVVWFIYRKDT